VIIFRSQNTDIELCSMVVYWYFIRNYFTR